MTDQGRETARPKVLVSLIVAAALAVVGVIAFSVWHPRSSPAGSAAVAAALTYPMETMTDIPAGTYTLRPSVGSDMPVAHLAIPVGWNSWVGPNKFNGHTPGGTNEDALDRMTWYAGLLVLEPYAVPQLPCTGQEPAELPAAGLDIAALARAIATAPDVELLGATESVTRFGHSAVHLTTRVALAATPCTHDWVLDTINNGRIETLMDGGTVETWVVDVDGHPMVVLASRWGEVPAAVEAELDSMLDSIAFVHES
jgi:hypothetical protein